MLLVNFLHHLKAMLNPENKSTFEILKLTLYLK
jgi:hypothetical protein